MDLTKNNLDGKKIISRVDKKKNKKKISQRATKVVDHFELKIIPKVKKKVIINRGCLGPFIFLR